MNQSLIYKNKKVTILTLLIAGIVIILVIGVYDPMQYAWMPKCIFKSLTGFDCPGCGATRATHALLHGHFLEAMKYNYFLLLGIPYAFLASLVAFIPKFHNSKTRKFIYSRGAALVYVTLFFAWWIVRNTSWFKELL